MTHRPITADYLRTYNVSAHDVAVVENEWPRGFDIPSDPTEQRLLAVRLADLDISPGRWAHQLLNDDGWEVYEAARDEARRINEEDEDGVALLKAAFDEADRIRDAALAEGRPTAEVNRTLATAIAEAVDAFHAGRRATQGRALEIGLALSLVQGLARGRK